jgi:adenosylhomocysteine nucleosidase
MAVIAVTGLRVEAEIVRKAGCAVVCAGGIPAHTAATLGQAIGAQTIDGGVPSGLVSFGIAGGLAPGLAPGTLVLADSIIAADGTNHPVDAAWRARVQASLGAANVPALGGDILGSDAIVIAAAEKAALRARFGAVAVDLESAVVARAAAGAGLPFIVIRAIADPAERDLPPAASVRLTSDGRPDLRAIFHSVLMGSGQIAALIRLARDTRRALRALTRMVAVAGAELAEPRRRD